MANTKATGPLSGVLTLTLEEALAGGETFLGLQQKTGVDRQRFSGYLPEEQDLAVETVDRFLGCPRRQNDLRSLVPNLPTIPSERWCGKKDDPRRRERCRMNPASAQA